MNFKNQPYIEFTFHENRNAYAQMKQDLETYQKSVQQTQQLNQQTAREQATLTCSEHSVFGKFDAFCARLKKILRLYDVIEKHENLLKSRMEGLLQEEDGITLYPRSPYMSLIRITQ